MGNPKTQKPESGIQNQKPESRNRKSESRNQRKQVLQILENCFAEVFARKK